MFFTWNVLNIYWHYLSSCQHWITQKLCCFGYWPGSTSPLPSFCSVTVTSRRWIDISHRVNPRAVERGVSNISTLHPAPVQGHSRLHFVELATRIRFITNSIAIQKVLRFTLIQKHLGANVMVGKTLDSVWTHLQAINLYAILYTLYLVCNGKLIDYI